MARLNKITESFREENNELCKDYEQFLASNIYQKHSEHLQHKSVLSVTSDRLDNSGKITDEESFVLAGEKLLNSQEYWSMVDGAFKLIDGEREVEK